MNNNGIQVTLGQCIKALRKQGSLTLEELASKCEITYQYLSGIENGKENFTVEVLEKIAQGLDIHPKTLVVLAYQDSSGLSPTVNQAYFRDVPLPDGLNTSHIQDVCNQTTSIIHRINQNLIAEVGKPLQDFMQGNNFSGLVSNILSDAFNDNSPYKHNHDQRYPDLINKDANHGNGDGLEIKTTINVGKGGESHNGHSGWHVVSCYKIEEGGDISFIHIMFANLNGHKHPNPDWTYLGSKENKDTGSRRTETYITNLEGTTKLRNGTVYLVPDEVDFRRWKVSPKIPIPPYSIFYNAPH